MLDLPACRVVDLARANASGAMLSFHQDRLKASCMRVAIFDMDEDTVPHRKLRSFGWPQTRTRTEFLGAMCEAKVGISRVQVCSSGAALRVDNTY